MSLNISATLTDEQQLKLRQAFPLIAFDFSNASKDLDHNFAAAVRQVNNFETYSKIDEEFIDIGSNPIDLLNYDKFKKSYSISPYVDEKDHVRKIFRERTLTRVINNSDDSSKRDYAYRVLNNDMSVVTRQKSPAPTPQAKLAVANHSLYDITPEQLHDQFDLSGIDLCFATLHYDPIMELVDEAPLNQLEAHYKIVKGKIEFFFQKDNSITYKHDYNNLRRYFTKSLFTSYKHNFGLLIEIEKHRLDTYYLTIARVPLLRGFRSVTHKLTSLYSENFYCFNAYTARFEISYRYDIREKYHLNETVFLVDKGFVDKVYKQAYEQKQPNLADIFSYMRGVDSRTIINGQQILSTNNIPPNYLVQILLTIFFRVMKDRDMTTDLEGLFTRAYHENRSSSNCFKQLGCAVLNTLKIPFIPLMWMHDFVNIHLHNYNRLFTNYSINKIPDFSPIPSYFSYDSSTFNLRQSNKAVDYTHLLPGPSIEFGFNDSKGVRSSSDPVTTPLHITRERFSSYASTLFVKKPTAIAMLSKLSKGNPRIFRVATSETAEETVESIYGLYEEFFEETSVAPVHTYTYTAQDFNSQIDETFESLFGSDNASIYDSYITDSDSDDDTDFMTPQGTSLADDEEIFIYPIADTADNDSDQTDQDNYLETGEFLKPVLHHNPYERFRLTLTPCKRVFPSTLPKSVARDEENFTVLADDLNEFRGDDSTLDRKYVLTWQETIANSKRIVQEYLDYLYVALAHTVTILENYKTITGLDVVLENGEIVGFKEKEREFLKDADVLTYHLLKRKISSYHDLLDNWDDYSPENMLAYNAPPGAGKSRRIAEVATIHDVVCASNKNTALELNTKVRPNVKTFTLDSIIMNRRRYPTDVLHVDEYTLVHFADIIYAIKVLRPRKVFLYGDVHQIKFINRYESSKALLLHQMPANIPIEHWTRTYRCPVDITLFLRKFYGPQFTTASETGSSFKKKRIISENDVDVNAYDLIITFTQNEKERLRSVLGRKFKGKILTIHEDQGDTQERVALVRLDKTAAGEIFSSQEHIIVGLTRHTVKLDYLCVADVELCAVDRMADEIETIGKKILNKTVKDDFFY